MTRDFELEARGSLLLADTTPSTKLISVVADMYRRMYERGANEENEAIEKMAEHYPALAEAIARRRDNRK